MTALCLAKTENRGEDLYKVKAGLIKLNSADRNLLRVWHLDLSSFEAVHGMSRVVKLIPDKVATAIAINLEDLPNPEDNGTFLVDLVTQLLEFFQKLVVEQETRHENNALLNGEDQVNSFGHSCRMIHSILRLLSNLSKLFSLNLFSGSQVWIDEVVCNL